MLHRMDYRVVYIGLAVLLFGLVCMISAGAEEFSSDAYWVEMTNRYIGIDLGVSGTVKPDTNTEWKIPGRWMVYTTEGDPDSASDNNHPLVYYPLNLSTIVPCNFFGFFKVKIGANVYMIGDAGGYYSKIPYAYTNPPAGYGVGRSGGFIDGEWTIGTAAAPIAAVKIRMSIVRDQARFEFTLVNKSNTSQTMGFMMVGDVMVDSNDSSGISYIPGYGYVRSATSSAKPYPQMFSGVNVPAYFDTYDSVESPTTVARNTLRQQDCTASDYLVLGEAADLESPSNWIPNDFNPDYMKQLDDLCWALCWTPKTLSSGNSRKIVTYYGVGAASAAWTYKSSSTMQQDQAVLALQGPRSLKYDSTTVGQNDLSPAPFTIKAYLYNLATDPGPYDLENVTMTLYLPQGLELTKTPKQTAQQAIGRVPVNSEALPATWQVQATGYYSGELEYFVTARASSGWQQIVSRKIMVPATKKFNLWSGWQLAHVPFSFNNPASDHALSLTAGTFAARYYDPATNQYLPVKQLEPGQAFWLYVANADRHQLAVDAAIVGEEFGKQTREQYIDLSKGWNLIGNPFVYPVYWGQVAVYNKVGNTTVSLDQAVKNNWLSKTLFTWIPESGTYENFKDNDRFILPWRGYWVKTNYPITLVFRPSVPPSSDTTSNPGGF